MSNWVGDKVRCLPSGVRDELTVSEIIYEFDISNVGTNFMNIARVAVTTNGVTVSFS
jgi:hypothetical protein